MQLAIADKIVKIMFKRVAYKNILFGGAFLLISVERLTDSQEVMGSIPTVSTTSIKSEPIRNSESVRICIFNRIPIRNRQALNEPALIFTVRRFYFLW